MMKAVSTRTLELSILSISSRFHCTAKYILWECHLPHTPRSEASILIWSWGGIAPAKRAMECLDSASDRIKMADIWFDCKFWLIQNSHFLGESANYVTRKKMVVRNLLPSTVLRSYHEFSISYFFLYFLDNVIVIVASYSWLIII